MRFDQRQQKSLLTINKSNWPSSKETTLHVSGKYLTTPPEIPQTEAAFQQYLATST